MMKHYEIVDTIAREKRVETMIENIARMPLTAELKDLAQMVYVILLEYDSDKVEELWEHDQINFFIARIILNQYKSQNSPYYFLFKRYAKHNFELKDED